MSGCHGWREDASVRRATFLWGTTHPRPVRSHGIPRLESLAFHDGVRHVAFTGLEPATPWVRSRRPGQTERATRTRHRLGTKRVRHPGLGRARASTLRSLKTARFQRERARACPRVPQSSFSRNEGVPGSSPGVGFSRLAGLLQVPARTTRRPPCSIAAKRLRFRFVGVKKAALVLLSVGRQVAVRPVDHLHTRPHPCGRARRAEVVDPPGWVDPGSPDRSAGAGAGSAARM